MLQHPTSCTLGASRDVDSQAFDFRMHIAAIETCVWLRMKESASHQQAGTLQVL